MLICNFTPDEIEWVHAGIHGFLKPGAIEEFPDGRANHILNQNGRRGILRYNLKDDDEAKRKEAMAIYRKFWMLQITVHNQNNEARKNENKPYTYPTDQLEEKAKELGVPLISPWKQTEVSESAQVSELKAKHKELETKVNALKEGQDKMLELLSQIASKPAVPHVVDTAELIKKFNTLDKHKYKIWVLEHGEEILGWPDQVQDKAREKWDSFYPDMEWPHS